MNFEDLSNFFFKSRENDDIRLTCQATEEICNFLDLYIEKQDNDSVLHTFCLLVQIAVCSRENPLHARREVESLYCSIATSSETSILEFYQLGDTIAFITSLCQKKGPKILLCCKITLPFQDCPGSRISGSSSYRSEYGMCEKGPEGTSNTSSSFESERKRVVINISTMTHLFALQRFWGNIFLKIVAMKTNVPINFQITKCLDTLIIMFSSLSTLDSPVSTVMSLCGPVVFLLEGQNVLIPTDCVPTELRISIALHLLHWISGLRNCHCRSIYIGRPYFTGIRDIPWTVQSQLIYPYSRKGW